MTHVVGIADMKISNREEDLLITYALGSCLGVAAYDPVARIGALLHAMLPSSEMDLNKAMINPYMFVDTGVQSMLEELFKLGARRERLVIKVAGGACMNGKNGDFFQIGKRNFLMLREVLSRPVVKMLLNMGRIPGIEVRIRRKGAREGP